MKYALSLIAGSAVLAAAQEGLSACAVSLQSIKIFQFAMR